MNHFTWKSLALTALLALPLSLTGCATTCDCSDKAPETSSAQAKAIEAKAASVNGQATILEDGTIQLPAPDKTRGVALMEAVSKRKSSRVYAPQMVSDQILADLCWVASGINRPETGGITIPTALGAKEIDLFAMTSEGVFQYDAKAHALTVVAKGDHRALAGKQDFATQAPLTFFLVADEARMKAKEPEAIKLYGAMTAAYASENLYLYAASENLSTVVRAYIDVPALSELLKLRPEQKLLLAQSVGHFPED